ncbi:MAG TPA: multifunctional CCA addition/repair protein [Candidatus Acidoferrum sp.]|nr:multifunctional CCA addition/repair protein [Candidatus Acidoferrum sp.]
MKCYKVGGAVRDKLLGLTPKEIDWVVVGATPQQMLDAGYQQVGRDFPVFLHPKTKQEYALARTERKSGVGYTGFVVHASPDVTLEQDLLRRDLTVNAIAEDDDGMLIDPYGGQRDLAARVLRHVSPAFAEDPLRVLRVARFAARFASLGFSVAPETLQLMRQLVEAGEMQHLIAERVWQELQRALETTAPQVFVRTLRDCGALAALLPELDQLFGVSQPEFFHPEIDTGIHMLMVVEQAAALSNELCVRFAALMHDLGKGLTPSSMWPTHTGHEEAGVALIETLCERLRVPNDCRELAVLVSRLHTRCHKALKHKAEDLFTTLEQADALRRPQRFEQFLLACEADARGRLGLERRAYPQAERLRQALQAARAIDVAPLAAQYSKQELGLAIKQARIAAIASRLERNA